MHTSDSTDVRSATTLKVRGLEGGYGNNQVLFGVDLDVGPGEIVAVIGHNGAGKSTLLRCILGLLPAWSGEIALGDKHLEMVTPQNLGYRGVAFVPQGGGAFTALSVRENLVVSASAIGLSARTTDVLSMPLAMFPALVPLLDQRAGTLSGGERQMLSLGMGIARNPRLLLVDEPSLGLSPSLTESVMGHLQILRDEHQIGGLVVEQKIRQVVAIADRVYVLRNGRVAHSGPAAELRDEEALIEAYL